MLETFNTNDMDVVIQAVLSRYASGHATGIGVDFGDGDAHIVAIFEGCALLQVISCLDLADRDFTEYMMKTSTERGYPGMTPAEREIGCDTKDKFPDVILDFHSEMRTAAESPDKEKIHERMDGNNLAGGSVCFRCPEEFVNPTIVGREACGTHDTTFQFVLQCDMDMRKDLCANVVRSGGTTMF